VREDGVGPTMAKVVRKVFGSQDPRG